MNQVKGINQAQQAEASQTEPTSDFAEPLSSVNQGGFERLDEAGEFVDRNTGQVSETGEVLGLLQKDLSASDDTARVASQSATETAKYFNPERAALRASYYAHIRGVFGSSKRNGESVSELFGRRGSVGADGEFRIDEGALGRGYGRDAISGAYQSLPHGAAGSRAFQLGLFAIGNMLGPATSGSAPLPEFMRALVPSTINFQFEGDGDLGGSNRAQATPVLVNNSMKSAEEPVRSTSETMPVVGSVSIRRKVETGES